MCAVLMLLPKIMKLNNATKSILCLGLFVGFVWVATAATATTTTRASSGAFQGRASVIDGDTLEIQGERIRLYGIDAPESAQTCLDANGRTYRCGQRAAFALSDKVGARPVLCEPTGKDRYGRIVARCSLAGEDLQAWMVRNGHALAFLRYSKAYRTHEAEAKASGVGMWTGSFEAPWDWRRRPKS